MCDGLRRSRQFTCCIPVMPLDISKKMAHALCDKGEAVTWRAFIFYRNPSVQLPRTQSRLKALLGTPGASVGSEGTPNGPWALSPADIATGAT